MDVIRASQHKGLILKIGIVWLAIFLLVSFLIATRSSANPITMSVIPEVPRTGEPIVATFNIANPADEPLTIQYQLYINGKLVESGTTTIAPRDSTKYQYAYRQSLERGEQVNFVLKTSSDNGNFDKVVSLPAYPSQLMSSFVSFAAFSTSVMSSMLSMEYFNSTFGTANGINTGVILVIVLIVLLIFLELTQGMVTGKGIALIGGYRAGSTIMSTILFIILIGMVFTKVVMIIAS
jgi:LEA14-like dessication related protein